MPQSATNTLGIFLLLALDAQGAGPGLPKLTFTSDELGKPLSYISTRNGLHGTVAMHQGYLAVIFAHDGSHNGGFAFYDISNPRQPKVFASHQDAVTQPMGEPHGWTMCGNVACINYEKGLHFWDWTDPAKPALLKALELPGIGVSDYDVGAWWSCWQGSYVYVGGSNNGLYVVEASDPKNPRFVKKLAPNLTGGFRVGPVFAVGNLLVLTNMDQAGYSTLDIGDPENPRLIAALPGEIIYASMVNGNKIIGAGLDGALKVYDIADPARIQFLGQGLKLGTEGGYAMVQDGFAFMGFAQGGFVKIDITKPGQYALSSRGGGNGEQKFVVPLGNMLWGGCIGSSSPISAHQAGPDLAGPEVNMVNPSDGRVNQPLGSRIGLTFTDMIDLSTVTGATFTVRPVGGAALTGRYAHQTGIVNFAPAQPLIPNTEYEVVVAAGGIKDWSGNGVGKEFRSRFTTGKAGTAVRGEARALFPGTVNALVFARLDGAPAGQIRYYRRRETGGMQVLELTGRSVLRLIGGR